MVPFSEWPCSIQSVKAHRSLVYRIMWSTETSESSPPMSLSLRAMTYGDRKAPLQITRFRIELQQTRCVPPTKYS